MQMQNIDEYRILRSEIEAVKSCITQYVGYMLTGSGLIFTVSPLATYYVLNRDNLQHERLQQVETILVFVSFVFCLIVSLITLIIFYKFNSHNRYCGYVRAIAAEWWENDTPTEGEKNQNLWKRLEHTTLIALKRRSLRRRDLGLGGSEQDQLVRTAFLHGNGASVFFLRLKAQAKGRVNMKVL